MGGRVKSIMGWGSVLLNECVFRWIGYIYGFFLRVIVVFWNERDKNEKKKEPGL